MIDYDPRAEARREAEEEQEAFDDLMVALRCLLRHGEKRAAITLIEKAFTQESNP